MHHSNRRPFPDPFEFLPRGLTKLHSIWVSLTYPLASKGRNMSFHFASHLDRQKATRISLGNSISLRKDAWLNVATDDSTGEPVIVIDDNCHIGYGSIISAKNRIHLERDVIVGQQVLMVDHNHAYEDITIPIANQGVTEGGQDPNWPRILDRPRGGHHMPTWRADNRPQLRCRGQLARNAKYPRLLRSFWIPCDDNQTIRSGDASLAYWSESEQDRASH